MVEMNEKHPEKKYYESIANITGLQEFNLYITLTNIDVT